MAKILKIESCGTCFHFSQGDSENSDHCWEAMKDFIEPWNGGFPDWCPLEDVPDTGEEEYSPEELKRIWGMYRKLQDEGKIPYTDETGMAVTGMRRGYRTGQAWETHDTGEE